MATFIEGVTAAQCWTCGHFYRLFFFDSIDFGTGEPAPKLRAPLGNPDIEERAWFMAAERSAVSFSEELDYANAVRAGTVLKPSKASARSLVERGAGLVSTPVHVMVPNKASRLAAPDVACRVSSAVLHAGSFVRDSEEGLLIASPEFCVLQLALKLPMPRLALLITELCSTYYFDHAESPELVHGEDGLLHSAPVLSERARSDRPVPVSCLRAMDRFARRVSTSKAGRAMARAVRYAVEGSASPMESVLALMLSLPKSLGV